MKMHYFYLMTSDIDEKDYPGIPFDSLGDKDFTLYAITEKKEYAKEFKRTRNMKLFKEVIHEFEDSYDFDLHVFINDFIDCYLEYNIYYDKIDNNGVIESRQRSILSTNNEYDVISLNAEEYLAKTVFKSDLTILRDIEFNKDIEIALDTLNFRFALELLYPSEGLNYDILRFNELELFVRFFSNTFRKDIFK